MNALMIINPVSGKMILAKYFTDISRILTEAGYTLDVRLTTAKDDARKIIESCGGDFDTVICCGGDGTLNETISGLMQAGIERPIGYIPSGSTNDMARTLAIPTKPIKAAELIMEGVPKPFDIGKFGDDKYFCYTASFGAFTRVSYSTPRKLKNVFGHFAYVLDGIAKASEELVPIKVKVKADNFETEGEFILGGIFNARSVAGLIKLDKCDVVLDDGLFELILIRNPKNPDDLYRTIKNIKQQDFTDDAIIFRRVKSAEFTFETPTAWSLDGESGGETKTVVIENLKHAVSIFGKKD